MDDDWDLQAVVRGCRLTSPAATSAAAAERDPFSFFPPFDLMTADLTDGDESFWRFSELPAAQAAFTELEQLCRPFSRPSPAVESSQRPRRPPQQSHASRSKRSRKNQQKRVVCQVPADGAASDLWAWRKYGQKPIKGSPYPRGYYRCSSSKGCPARKQVERSLTDPSLLAITYTADHNHPQPTHRNSLAGTTRNKVSTAAAASDSQPPEKPTSSPLSPTTPLVESMEDEMDELLFMGMEEVSGGGPTSAAGGDGGADSDFLAGDDELNEHFFPPSWMASNNNSSAATAL